MSFCYFSLNPNSPTGPPDYQNILSHLKSTSITPGGVTSPPPRPPRGINTKSPTPSNRSQQSNGGNSRFYPLMTNDEYVELQPTRPAPMPPNPPLSTPYSPLEQKNQQKPSNSANNSNYNTLAVYNGNHLKVKMCKWIILCLDHFYIILRLFNIFL